MTLISIIPNILLNENSYENLLIYYVPYKTVYGASPSQNIFDKKHGDIRKYTETEYLTLF